MAKTISKTYTYRALCGLAFYMLLGCTGNGGNLSTEDTLAQTDSVFAQIKKGRDQSLDPETRRNLLHEAYENVQATGDDSLKTKYFSRLSLAYLRLSDSLWFRKTNKETLELAQKTYDSTVLAEAHWDLAEFYQNHAISDSAYFHYEEAYRIYHQLKDKYYEGRMLYNMAAVQGNVKDYTGSESTTISAIEILKPLNNYRELYNCYNNLGAIANNLQEYDRAIEYHQTALEYLDKFDNQSILRFFTLNNIGVVYQDMGEHKKAIPYFQQVLSADGIAQKNEQLYARTLNNMAYNRFKSGDTTGVENQLLRAFHIRDSINDVIGMTQSHYSLAELYLDRTDTAKALLNAKKAQQYAKQSTNNERLLETLELLSRLDPDNAVSYSRKYIKLNDSLLQEERKARNKFARIRFETDEFIEENKLLTKEKQLWTGIAVGLLLLAGAIYVIVNQRAKNQKLLFQQQQQVSNNEIFNLMLSQSQKVEEGKQIEQKRVSEELHDGVLGKMLGARMVLTGLNKKNDPQAVEERAKAIKALQNIESEVRAISHELSHSAYQKIHNFISSIEELLATVEETGNINIDLKYDNTLDWDGLHGEIKINLYRMVQEILQNSVKHANCQNVFLNFVKNDNNLDITIRDDGKGFHPKRGKKGIGMRNIASRIDKLKGTWKISSKINKGTTVNLKIPISNDVRNTKKA